MTRLVMWRSTEWPGMEHTEIREDAGGIEIDGLIVAYMDGEALRLGYGLRCEALAAAA